MQTIDRILDFFGSKRQLAEKLNVSPQAICKWERTQIPSDRAIQIEHLTKGKITSVEIRPDLISDLAA